MFPQSIWYRIALKPLKRLILGRAFIDQLREYKKHPYSIPAELETIQIYARCPPIDDHNKLGVVCSCGM